MSSALSISACRRRASGTIRATARPRRVITTVSPHAQRQAARLLPLPSRSAQASISLAPSMTSCGKSPSRNARASSTSSTKASTTS
jgi:hypothetical protein